MTDEASATDSPLRPTVHIPNPTYLYVIFDGPSGPESGRFVELEDEHGQSVGGATWEERGDGFWSLGPFLQPPAEVAEQPASELGAMVRVFLADCERSAHALGLARGTAESLKTALAQREAVMGEMAKALTGMQAVVAESAGIEGWHLNGALAKWGEFDFVADADTALAKYRGEQ